MIDHWEPDETILDLLRRWRASEVENAVSSFASNVECTGRLDEENGVLYVDADAFGGNWEGVPECTMSRKTLSELILQAAENHRDFTPGKKITGAEAVSLASALDALEETIAEVRAGISL